MWKNLKNLAGYYKPYLRVFLADMFFAMLVAAVALVLPLMIRYITYDVIHLEPEVAIPMVLKLGALMLILVLIEIYGNFFITYSGHVMGAKIEYDMRSKTTLRSIAALYQSNGVGKMAIIGISQIL